jgi:hypothetical protein
VACDDGVIPAERIPCNHSLAAANYCTPLDSETVRSAEEQAIKTGSDLRKRW